jgi:hypothetical protein
MICRVMIQIVDNGTSVVRSQQWCCLKSAPMLPVGITSHVNSCKNSVFS